MSRVYVFTSDMVPFQGGKYYYSMLFRPNGHNLIQNISVPLSLACVLVQMVCLLSIAIAKAAYRMDEKQHQRLNATSRIHPIIVESKTEKVHVENLRYRNDGIYTIEHGNNYHQHNTATNHRRHNTTAHNKILLEIYHLSFLALAGVVALASTTIKENLKNKDVLEEYSRALLCILDLAPRLLISVLLPTAIYVRNQEVQNYINGMFSRATQNEKKIDN